ncbi:MAG: polysaccharide transporter [Bacilli bacterium]|nr:polysaccharide transporter [Bacilli bacterium]
MRTKNSIKNTLVSFITNIVTIVIGLVAQAVFIKTLGNEYLGINGLFSNIISMLGIVELGIGSAIIYHLYKPIAENNSKQVKALMNFYKKCYNIIALAIFIIGLIITPYLPLFIENITIDINISLVYIMFIIEVVCSYLLSYKRSLINANQKSYVVNLIHIGYLIILNLIEIIILIATKNYYLYLIIKIIMRLLENIILSIIANKLYSYLKNNSEELDKETKKDIFKKVKALFFHKIGGFIVLGTDNIIISKYLGIITVGLYSNYALIIEAVNRLFGQVINTLTPSVGNLLVENNSTKNFHIFKKVRFLNFWIATFSGISILIIMESFIKIWIGKEFILPLLVLYILVINYYQRSMRTCFMVFKEASGIYYEDRFVPLIESALNIIASLILLKYFGLSGIFMGTIISSLALWCYSYPKYVYKKLFNRSYINYIKETIGYLSIFILLSIFTYIFKSLFTFNNDFLEFIVNSLIALIIPNLILLLIFFKTDNFKYYLNLLKDILKKKVKK